MRTPKRYKKELQQEFQRPHGTYHGTVGLGGRCPDCGTNVNSQYVLDTHPCTWSRDPERKPNPMHNYRRLTEPIPREEETMADVVICDLAGEITSRSSTSVIRFATVSTDDNYVVCPDCAQKVYDYMETMKNGSKAVVQAPFDPVKRAEDQELALESGSAAAETTRRALDEEYGG